MTTGASSIGSLIAFSVLASCMSGGPERAWGSNPEEPVGQISSALNVCAEDETLTGIDVSHHQGVIDWDAVASDPQDIKFAFIRYSDGSYHDRQFDRNWSEAERVGLIRGVYQYFRPERNPQAQAQDLVDAIGGALGPNDLPPVIDVEWTDSDDNLTDAELTAAVAEWVDYVYTALGRWPIIYTNAGYWENELGSDLFIDLPVWLAHYGVDCPRVPTVAWQDWLFHQYTDQGSVDGVDTNVDMDRFNGSIADLRAFVAGLACTPGCEGSLAYDANCAAVDCNESGLSCIEGLTGGRCAPSACVESIETSFCDSEGNLVRCAQGSVLSESACDGNLECTPSSDGAACIEPEEPDLDGGTAHEHDGGISDAPVEPASDADAPSSGENKTASTHGIRGGCAAAGNGDADGSSWGVLFVLFALAMGARSRRQKGL